MKIKTKTIPQLKRELEFLNLYPSASTTEIQRKEKEIARLKG